MVEISTPEIIGQYNPIWGLPGGDGSVVKNPSAMQELQEIPGSGRSPEEGHGNSLQYSCLENPMDKGVWWVTVHRVTKSWPQLKQISTHNQFLYFFYFYFIIQILERKSGPASLSICHSEDHVRLIGSDKYILVKCFD